MTNLRAKSNKGFKVAAKTCVSDDEVLSNVEQNINLLEGFSWLKPCVPHAKHAVIVSAGPSVFKRQEEIRELAEREDTVIFCVKHSLLKLKSIGVTPDFCVVLDPRPITGISTHGAYREDLFREAPESVKFLVASMTHPSVTKFLIDKYPPKNIIGWHAMVKVTMKHPKTDTLIHEGTSSATRSIGIARVMGFRNITLVGFDSSLEKEPSDLEKMYTLKENGQPQFIPLKVGGEEGGTTYWTTGELSAQAQDLEYFAINLPCYLNVTCFEDGLGGAIFNKTRPHKNPSDYLNLEDFLG
jgi:hypothetical protein